MKPKWNTTYLLKKNIEKSFGLRGWASKLRGYSFMGETGASSSSFCSKLNDIKRECSKFFMTRLLGWGWVKWHILGIKWHSLSAQLIGEKTKMTLT